MSRETTASAVRQVVRCGRAVCGDITEALGVVGLSGDETETDNHESNAHGVKLGRFHDESHGAVADGMPGAGGRSGGRVPAPGPVALAPDAHIPRAWEGKQRREERAHGRYAVGPLGAAHRRAVEGTWSKVRLDIVLAPPGA